MTVILVAFYFFWAGAININFHACYAPVPLSPFFASIKKTINYDKMCLIFPLLSPFFDWKYEDIETKYGDRILHNKYFYVCQGITVIAVFQTKYR